eukprot:TRINITY_DN12366_c0_g1_i1.p1 TRINITY_DN12366_c0_g1~~TRINITY_DN12366_c0_g1_i1.p1  ORF type:complete len:81 (+),score=9.48 TRINITY_DN12366_c0_g1_i1:126-368(+)
MFVKSKEASEGVVDFNVIGTASEGEVFESSGTLMYSNLAPPKILKCKKEWFRPDVSLVSTVALQWSSTSQKFKFLYFVAS